jgi:hypothetical protein
MPPPPEPSRVEISPGTIEELAPLYDRFAHALDPFSEERDRAEQDFMRKIAELHDSLSDPKPKLQDFRRKIVDVCQKHLRANRRTSTI